MVSQASFKLQTSTRKFDLVINLLNCSATTCTRTRTELPKRFLTLTVCQQIKYVHILYAPVLKMYDKPIFFQYCGSLPNILLNPDVVILCWKH